MSPITKALKIASRPRQGGAGRGSACAPSSPLQCPPKRESLEQLQQALDLGALFCFPPLLIHLLRQRKDGGGPSLASFCPTSDLLVLCLNATCHASPRDAEPSPGVTLPVGRAGARAWAVWLEQPGAQSTEVQVSVPHGGDARVAGGQSDAGTLGRGCHPSSSNHTGPDKREQGRDSHRGSQQDRATVPLLLSLNPFL